MSMTEGRGASMGTVHTGTITHPAGQGVAGRTRCHPSRRHVTNRSRRHPFRCTVRAAAPIVAITTKTMNILMSRT